MFNESKFWGVWAIVMILVTIATDDSFGKIAGTVAVICSLILYSKEG